MSYAVKGVKPTEHNKGENQFENRVKNCFLNAAIFKFCETDFLKYINFNKD